MTLAPPARLDDPERLRALWETALLDTDAEDAFDRLTRLAVATLDVPVALVSLVDANRQFFKSCIGLPEPWGSTRETPLSHSFCQHAVASGEPLVIEDARVHPLRDTNLAIADLGVVAYAGIPLFTSEGFALGTFCVIDHEPRTWTEAELAILRDLASAAMTEIELRAQSRRSQELTLRLSAEHDRLCQLVERLHDGVIAVDAEGIVEFANGAARRLPGFEGVAVGEPLPDPWLRGSLREFVARLFAPEAPESHAAFAVGPDATYAVSGLPPRGSESAVLVIVDISARDRHERAEREFVTNAAHELQTPLTAISSAIEVLQAGAKDVPADRDLFLADVDRECRRLRRLARALLVLASVDNRAGDPPTAPVDLCALLADIAATVKPTESVAITSQCPDGLLVKTNADLLEQILTNLVANSAKHTRAGSITLSAREAEDAVVVEVRDTGTGIAPRDRARVFDRFYRGDGERTEGFGLGLAIVDQSVRALGGTIDLAFGARGGTTVTVTLPR